MTLCDEPVAGDTCQLEADHIVPCSSNPEDAWISIPAAPYAEIVPRLYVGASMNMFGGPLEPDPELFDSVLTLWRSAGWCDAPINERRFIFTDGREIPDNIGEAVAWVWGQWAVQKRHVLIRCQAGLNRSSLVAALTLIQDGHDPEDAIRVLREKRSPFALCNRFFVDYLRSLA